MSNLRKKIKREIESDINKASYRIIFKSAEEKEKRLVNDFSNIS